MNFTKEKKNRGINAQLYSNFISFTWQTQDSEESVAAAPVAAAPAVMSSSPEPAAPTAVDKEEMEEQEEIPEFLQKEKVGLVFLLSLSFD